MNKKKIIMAVLLLIIVALCLNVFVQKKFIKTYTFTELEYRGYTAQDVSEIEIKHSYLNRILSYNEWRISVEFVEEPNVLFWFTYRDGKIIFQGVSSEPMLAKEAILDYSGTMSNKLITGYGVQLLYAIAIFVLGVVTYRLKKAK